LLELSQLSLHRLILLFQFFDECFLETLAVGIDDLVADVLEGVGPLLDRFWVFEDLLKVFHPLGHYAQDGSVVNAKSPVLELVLGKCLDVAGDLSPTAKLLLPS
jgi:hypothetical protein